MEPFSLTDNTHPNTTGFIIIIIKGICVAPTWSLSVQLITLKCYPVFLGFFTVKEKKGKYLRRAFQFD